MRDVSYRAWLGAAWLFAAAGASAQPAPPGPSAAPAAGEACKPEAAAPAVILPTAGAIFSLPPDPAAASACAPPAPPPPVRPPAPNLFRMVAVPVSATPLLRKWEAARRVSVAGQPGPWSELLEQANRVTGGNPFVMFNMWVNWHVRYQRDAGDDWADVLTTLRRGVGDCEDIAIAKMALLAALGVSPDDMYLVLLRDSRREDHAVLAVRRAGSLYILDNRTDKLLAAALVTDYTPIESFSGDFAWTYGRRLG